MRGWMVGWLACADNGEKTEAADWQYGVRTTLRIWSISGETSPILPSQTLCCTPTVEPRIQRKYDFHSSAHLLTRQTCGLMMLSIINCLRVSKAKSAMDER